MGKNHKLAHLQYMTQDDLKRTRAFLSGLAMGAGGTYLLTRYWPRLSQMTQKLPKPSSRLINRTTGALSRLLKF